MNPHLELTGNNSEGVVTGAPESGAPAAASLPKRLRRLKWNEVVSRGDFVADEHQGFKPWAGPNGFQADSFVRPIYRAPKASRPQLKN